MKDQVHFKHLRRVLLYVSLFGMFGLAFGELDKLPPGLLTNLGNMSPAEQQALAKQYGFDLESVLRTIPTGTTSRQEDVGLGTPGEPIDPREYGGLEQRVLRERDKDSALEDEALRRFGSNLFDAGVGTFSPVDNLPIPKGYLLGVGDEIRVMFIGKEQGEYLLVVDRDGSVAVPRLGRVVLSGLTFSQAKELLEKQVSERLIGTEAFVTMGSLRSINVFIAGEVERPGSYSVSSLFTLSQAIFVAGGIADTGSYRQVQHKRQGKLVGAFDLYDLLLYGDNSADNRLQGGDVVFVPTSGPLVSLYGEIVRPAIYETLSGDSIGEVLKMAGGFKSRAYKKQILLNRYEAGEALPSIATIDLEKPSTSEMMMLDGDILKVRAVTDRVANPIQITGETELEETIGWFDGMRISDVFADVEGSLKPTADLTLSLIIRRKNSLNDILVLPISISGAVNNSSSTDNIELQPFDEILVLPLPGLEKEVPENIEILSSGESREIRGMEDEDELDVEGNFNLDVELSRLDLMEPIVKKLKQQSRSGERAQVVEVAGAVQLPGEYPLLGDGSVLRTIALAGGFLDSSYLRRVEVRRITLQEDGSGAGVEFVDLDLTTKKAQEFKLLGRDTIRINTIPNWSTEDSVELAGEFLFPGFYKISEGETVLEVVNRAGGFTRDAFLNGGQFFSAAARASQKAQLTKITQSVARTMATREAIGGMRGVGSQDNLLENIDESLLGRVVIDLEGILAGELSSNIILGTGDRIYVPKFSNTIAVVGEVYEPGTFKYVPGATVEEYIEIAGGHTEFGLIKNMYLLKADGSVQSSRGNRLGSLLKFNNRSIDFVEPGDAIVVPTDLNYDPPLQRLSTVTQVVFQSFTSLAAFLNLTNQ